jgi:hypothetical protein
MAVLVLQLLLQLLPLLLPLQSSAPAVDLTL